MSDKELKYRLRAIEANLRRRYPNGVSKNFDISGSRFDRNMAKDLLKLGIKSEQKPDAVPETQEPAKTETPAPTATETKTETPAPAAPETPKPNGNLTPEEQAAFARLKQGKGTDADLALFSKYSKEELAAMGFGPKSIEAILGAKQSAAPAVKTKDQGSYNGGDESPDTSNMDQNAKTAGEALSKGGKYSQGIGKNKTYFLDGKQVDEATYKADAINKKIAKLEQERAVHEGIMKQYPDRPDIQSAQQTWIDSINKSIEKQKAKLNPKPAQN